MKHHNTRRKSRVGPARRARAYASPLRLEQAAQTRQRIIKAYGDELLGGDDRDLTVQGVARRAGVSVPTLYRNFESLDVLGDAFWATLEPTLGSLQAIRSADDLAPYTEHLFTQFDVQPHLGTMLWSRAGRRLRDRTVNRRNQTFRQALAPLTRRLPEHEALAATAMCKVISSGHVWELLHRDWGLSGEEAGRIAGWAIRTLIDALRKNPTSLGLPQPPKGR